MTCDNNVFYTDTIARTAVLVDMTAESASDELSCDDHVRLNGPPLSPWFSPWSQSDAERPVGGTRDNTRGM